MSDPTLAEGEFWVQADIHHDTICAKLDAVGRSDLVGRMRDCHTSELVISCAGCGIRRVVSNRCEKRWCPLCVSRLARERRDQLTWWIATLKQPKHVVVTSRNTETLTRETVRNFRRNLTKLRRTGVARDWKSGTWSLEVTNESRGWHLHAHLLVETRWIDSGSLAQAWGKLVGQDYAIVKVKDGRRPDYLRELAKYVVKSSQLAGWKDLEIADFMDAFTGTRTFGVFGSLVGQRGKWKQELRELRKSRSRCECGCNQFHVVDSRIDQLEPRDQIQLKKPSVDRGAVVRTRRNRELQCAI
jgi:Replication protein